MNEATPVTHLALRTQLPAKDRADPTSVPPPVPDGRSTPSPMNSSGALILLISMTCLASGCACWQRDALEANIVAGRQLSLRGIDCLQCGKLDDAESLFSDALRKNPADERSHRHYAEVMWQRGAHGVAIRHMEESVRLSGGDPYLLVQLGEMYLGQGNVEAAWDCAEDAIASNHRLANAWALRGDVYRARNQGAAALENYHRALSEQPHFPAVQLAVAQIYLEQHRPQRALATLDTLAAAIRPEDAPSEMFHQQGLTFKALGRYDDAVMALSAAAQRQDPPPDLLYELGEAQLLAGNTASARLALQAALQRAPSHQPSLQLQQRLESGTQNLTASIKR